MRTMEIGIGTVTHLAFSPDGELLAASGYTGIALGRWPAVAEGRQSFSIASTDERIAQLAWNPKGYYFATAGIDHGIVQIRDNYLRIRRELTGLLGQNGPVSAISYSTDGERFSLACGWWDEPATAIVLDPYAWRTVCQLELHTNQIGAMKFAHPSVLITGSADRTVGIHSLENQMEDPDLRRMPSPIQALVLSPTNDRLAVAAGNMVHLWRLNDQFRFLPVEELACRGHKGEVRAVSYSPDGKLLASVGKDGSLRFWNANTVAMKQTLDLGLGGLRAVTFAPDGLTVVAAGDSGTMAIVDVDS